MVEIECKDGNLLIGDWVLNHYFCRDLLKNGKNWISTHTTKEVQNELCELALK